MSSIYELTNDYKLVQDMASDPEIDPQAIDDTFTVIARRCKRCGGLLTSKEAVQNGFGHTCLRKTKDAENEKRGLDGQLNLFQEERGQFYDK